MPDRGSRMPQAAINPRAFGLIEETLCAQDVAKREIVIVIYELQLALDRCRKTISAIPERDGSARRDLEDRLSSIERMMDQARTAARSL